MPVTLLPWQEPLKQSIVNVWKSGLFLNACGTGTGKTYVALAALEALGRKALVIAPKAALTAWHRVADDMGLSSQLVGTINPERISLGRCPWYDGNQWSLPEGCAVVWDEPHKSCSGPDSLATKAFARLHFRKVPILAMSATIADSPLKLRAIGYAAGLHDFSTGGYRRFCLAHGCFTQAMPNGGVRMAFTKNAKAAQKHMAAIREKIGERMLYLPVNQIPGFPESFVESRLFDLDKESTGAVQRAYEEMEERMKSDGTHELTAILHARERAEWCKTELLAELVVDALEEGKSIVVFLNFRSVLARLEAALKGKASISTIHGDQNSTQRQTNIDEFQQNKTHVCLCMIQAGGVAVSLHDVRQERPRVSFLTPGWSASETVQALGRIRRTGGTPVTQTFVLAAGTCEEKIHKALQRKLGNIEAINDKDLIP